MDCVLCHLEVLGEATIFAAGWTAAETGLMGYFSDLEIRMTEGGMSLWHTQDKSVCPGCFEDDGLRAYIRSIAQPCPCSYCGRAAEGAAPLEDVVHFIRRSLSREWTSADGELPYDKEEGQHFLATTYSTEELLCEAGLDLTDSNGALWNDLARALPDLTWCAADPLAAAPHEAIANSWQSFCGVIKHQRRFFFREFLSTDQKKELEERESAYTIPDLLEALASFSCRAGLVVRVPSSTIYIRAMGRPDPAAAPFGPRRMGPPPAAFAKQPNRMSPAGIPMFYGAVEAETALREVTHVPGDFALGHFEVLRDLQLLDLCDVPDVPSLFDESRARDRAFARFMKHFISDFRQPSTDAQEVDYVPTQVVTEYFRSAVRHDGQPIDGILYKSTRCDGTAVVLFADTFDVEDSDAGEDAVVLGRWDDHEEEPKLRRWLRMSQYAEQHFDPGA
jgi:hypothetical protein